MHALLGYIHRTRAVTFAQYWLRVHYIPWDKQKECQNHHISMVQIRANTREWYHNSTTATKSHEEDISPSSETDRCGGRMWLKKCVMQVSVTVNYPTVFPRYDMTLTDGLYSCTQKRKPTQEKTKTNNVYNKLVWWLFSTKLCKMF